MNTTSRLPIARSLRVVCTTSCAIAAALAIAASPTDIASASGEDEPDVVSTAELTGISDPLAFILSEHFPELREWSTASFTGISDPLAFILSEHFPELDDNSGFEVPDRCRIVSPLPCD